jgi:hypothetical protein
MRNAPKWQPEHDAALRECADSEQRYEETIKDNEIRRDGAGRAMGCVGRRIRFHDYARVQQVSGT